MKNSFYEFKHNALTPRSGPPAHEVDNEPELNPETLEIVMHRVPVKKVLHVLPESFYIGLEQNQQIKSCCRHPENHSIEGWKSHPREPAPDVYIFYCDCCNNKHRVFCCGETDLRPIWNRTL